MRSSALRRRQFLGINSGLFGAVSLQALACRVARDGRTGTAQRPPVPRVDGFGPLRPARDETTGLALLHLPEGFRYLTFGWTGDPLTGGERTPGAHDGMAAFPAEGSRIRLVRNHELREGGAFAESPAYDRKGPGGTTTIEFDVDAAKVTGAWASLAGTAVNCAGGPTPWGSWLSCEETMHGPGGLYRYGKPHGYVFEVPSDGTASAEPYPAMGRFRHEAVAVDPDSGMVYETEDQPKAGLYRFAPKQPGRLGEGGSLAMLALADRPRADTRKGQTVGAWRDVRWVPIEEPDPRPIASHSVYRQGRRQGGATFGRLEGAWHGNDRIYVVSTDGGDAHAGQVWEYEPAQERVRLLFESPGRDVLDMPDNVCVSPRGGLVLCEDGGNENYLRGLTADGAIFSFAKNAIVLRGERNGLSGNFRDMEFAGATFSPDGRWLFFNAQRPGITFAVTGPWQEGLL